MKKYRPVRILNCFSKIYEKFLHEQLRSSVNKFSYNRLSET